MSWKYLAGQQPELAAFGVERLNGRVAYLATVRKDGSPRLHPMTPIFGQGHLLVFMEPTSSKGHDLQRDGRYAIHCSVSDTSGEFIMSLLNKNLGSRYLAKQQQPSCIISK